jgi:hypothetical protein
MNGLRVIVDNAVKGGTLHVMAPPPDRAAFESREEYERAYDAWYRKMNYWTVTNIGD